MKSTISICLMASLILIFTGCKKDAANQAPAPNQDSQLKQTALSTLKSQMSTESFADLDLGNAKELNLDGTPALMIIPSKTNSNKSLYFGNLKNNITANWVEHQGKVQNGKLVSETILLTDLQNNQLNTLVVKNNHLIGSGSQMAKSTLGVTKKTLDTGDGFTDPADLGEVVVTGYIPASNNYLEFYGLYWLFNFNPIYSNLYSLDQYSISNNANSGELIDLSANEISYETHITNAIVTNLGNGNVQITSEDPNAFFASGLNIKFNINPANKTFDFSSLTSRPTGYVFIGSWTFDKIESVNFTNNLLTFDYSYENAYQKNSATFLHIYKMHIMYDMNTNLMYWTWISKL